MANSLDPDQTPSNSASYPGPSCLYAHLNDTLIIVKGYIFCSVNKSNKFD